MLFTSIRRDFEIAFIQETTETREERKDRGEPHGRVACATAGGVMGFTRPAGSDPRV